MNASTDESPGLVYVAGTDPVTGRFRAHEIPVRPAQVPLLLDALTDVGGYVEVRRSAGDYPWMAVSVLRGSCVVHWFIGPDEVALLDGDGSLDDSATIELPLLHEPAVFSGACVVTLDRARRVLDEFVSTTSARPSTGWTLL